MSFKAVRFPRETGDFFKVLKGRVDSYFEDNQISRNADWRMVSKTIFMLALYFIPYVLLVTNSYTSLWVFFGLWAVMGFGNAGIGLSIMHDANHGSYSKTPWINDFIGKTIDIVGGNAINWKIQHNVLHHSFTNINDMDEDISRTKLLRFCKHQDQKSAFKFQHLYAWFLYGLLTVSWITTKDFQQLIRYKKKGLIAGQGRTFAGVLTELIIMKILYYTYMLVIPYYVMDISFGYVLAGFFMMHFICGLTLGLIFQPAHVTPDMDFPLPNDMGDMENSWAIHQLRTTTNFARENRLFSWYVGGLNYQVEHHLFPGICHVHYREISKIVEQTTSEYGIPYHSNPTFVGAVWQHAKMLKKMGHQKVEPQLAA
jgi:linoleoyl-CoA desaturase